MRQSGFTLLELSIVIVIIGLIVAGISAGQSLVQQASLRSILGEVNQFKAGINSFKLQYDALPGDMSNAHSYWSGCDTGATAGDCNGDGNKIINFTASTTNNECMRAWQHLSLANVIEGTYIGTSAVAGGGGGSDDNQLPYSKGKGKYYIFGNSPNNTFSLIVSNVISLGGTSVASDPTTAGFTVNEARNIDLKLDDGIANAGRTLAVDGVTGVTSGDCSAPGSTAGGADYNSSNLGDDTLYCYLVFGI